MKKLFIAALLCVGFSICAQEVTETKKKVNKEAKSPEKTNEARLSKMTTELNLRVPLKTNQFLEVPLINFFFASEPFIKWI